MPNVQEDRDYYLRRIADCTEMAARTTCPSARHAYEDLIRLYQEKLDTMPSASTARPDLGTSGAV